jgi:transposase-like protein
MIHKIDFEPRRVRRANTIPADRTRWVQRLWQSGLSPQAFARKHDLSVSTLCSWIRQAEQTAATKPPVALHEVSLSTMLCPWAAEVTRPDGVTVRLSAQVARELLAGLLGTDAC